MINPPFVRSPYNYDVEEASNSTAYVESMPSLTVQSQTEDSDLNVLMKRFGITGHMPQNVRQPSYGDFTEVTDFHSALKALHSAQEAFMQFPADIRAGFNNDPQLFLDFIENPANIETTRKWFGESNGGQDSSGNRVSGAVQSSASGGAASPSSAPTPPGGAGAAPSDGGAGVSQ